MRITYKTIVLKLNSAKTMYTIPKISCMKHFIKMRSIFVFTLATFTLLSCNDDDINEPPRPSENVIDLVTAETSLSTLLIALERANLRTTLEGNGPFTILAPTNAAFTSFLANNGFNSLEEVPIGTLTQLLKNHVISSELESSDLASATAGYSTTLAEGPVAGTNLSIYFNTSAGVTFNGTSNVSRPDLRASNGVIHIVEAIVPLPSVVTFVTTDPNFSSLASALTSDGQPDFVTTLSTANGTPPAPFTIFAPVNEAFAALTSNPSGTFLTSILEHHVITDQNLSAADINNDQVSNATLEGDTLFFTVVGTTISVRDGAGNEGINFIVSDLQTTNGVIHAIDQVLIPETMN